MKAYQLDLGWEGGYVIFSDSKENAIERFLKIMDGWAERVRNYEYLNENVVDFDINEETIINFVGE